jgi:hypothetical protein
VPVPHWSKTVGLLSQLLSSNETHSTQAFIKTTVSGKRSLLALKDRLHLSPLSPCLVTVKTGGAQLSLEEMVEKPRLVPQTTLFGKVVVYECTACGKSFPMPLLEGAVPSDLPAPYIIRAAFLDHDCKGSNLTR